MWGLGNPMFAYNYVIDVGLTSDFEYPYHDQDYYYSSSQNENDDENDDYDISDNEEACDSINPIASILKSSSFMNSHCCF